MTDCFLVNEDVVLVEDIDGDNNQPALGTELGMTESSSTPGYYYGWFVGELNPGGLPGDTLDSLRISASSVGGSTKGKTLTVTLGAQLHGSLLDAKITVYGSDGSTVLTTQLDNDFDSTGDPIIELPLTENHGTLYIAIEAEDYGDAEGSNSYFGFVSLS